MPSGYPIADNLTTDSAQQALSARQGKEIGEFLAIFDPVDISSVTTETAFITNPGGSDWSNVWLLDNSSYKCKLIPVTAGDKYRLEANSSRGFTYAVLASNTKSQQTTPDYASGYISVVSISAGATADITVPSDGAYLYVSVLSNGNDSTPTIKQPKSTGLAESVETILARENAVTQAKISFLVAAADAPSWQKEKADYICTGTNDEIVIQRAVNALASTGGRIVLSIGTFYIDSFPNTRSGSDYPYCAIMLPQNSVEYDIEGTNFKLTNGGTEIQISETCYEGLDSSKYYCVIGAGYVANQINARIGLQLRNIRMRAPWNQKRIMFLDCLKISRVYAQFCNFACYLSGYNGHIVNLDNSVDPPIQGCVGIRSTGGSNYGIMLDFRNISCSGFYEGIKVGGEHFVGINLGASQCHYGYTFGNYTMTGISEHDAILINCSDERNMCGPYFHNCASHQAVYLIGFNMETVAAYIPGGERLQEATEQTPGKFRGRVEYTIMNSSWWNDPKLKFWEHGHGHGFISRNMAHLPACSTTERNSYAPDYLERIWDTTLGKEVVCVDTANKTWKDTMGNTV